MNKGSIVFLSFLALIILIDLIRFFYYYTILFKLMRMHPEEKLKASKANKYKLIFSKDWFEDETLEYRRIQAREALDSAVVFLLGFVTILCLFAFAGT